MSKIINITAIALFFILELSSSGFSQETMTITTYYPSPYGNYRELTAHKMKIGRTYSVASPAGPTVNDDNVLIEGNVSIGSSTNSIRKLRVLQLDSSEPLLQLASVTSAAGKYRAGIEFCANPHGGVGTGEINLHPVARIFGSQWDASGEYIGGRFIVQSRINSGDWVDTLTVQNNMVGIATVSPGFTLDVNGSTKIQQSLLVFDKTTIANPAGEIALPASGKLLVYGGLELGTGRAWEGPFTPNPAFYSHDNFILFRDRAGGSEDFIGYRNNAFYFKDALGGGDTSDPDVYGNFVGTFSPPSSRKYKENILPLKSQDYQNILENIKKMDLVYFDYKGANNKRTNLGLIAEDAPAQIVGTERTNINLSDYISFVAAGLKAVIKENEILKKRVETLESQLKNRP